MTIRQRILEDLPAVARLLEAAHLPSDGLERTEGWVVEQAGQIIGHIAIEMTPDAAVLRSLAVQAGQGGRGLARQLMETAEAHGGRRTLVLKTDSIGPWAERRGYRRATLAQLPASVLATTQFEGALCSGYPVFMKP